MQTFVKTIRGYQIRIAAASEAQAQEAMRQFARLPLPMLDAFEREDRATRDGTLPERAQFLQRCA
jgi:molecular chaperone GrpE (heat shock protein)